MLYLTKSKIGVLSPIILSFFPILSSFYVESINIDELRRNIIINNDSGKRVELFWVSENIDELVPQLETPIVNGGSASLNSYVSHTFQISELPSLKTGICGDQESEICHAVQFTVNKHHNQIFTIKKNWKVDLVDDFSIAMEGASELMRRCEDRLSDPNSQNFMNKFKNCLKENTASEFQRSNDELRYQENLRVEMANKWEDYACMDDSLPTTSPILTEAWNREGINRRVDILHDKPASQIHLLHDFISEEECAAMEESAKPLLHQATVANGLGGSQLSPSRKALQAGISVPWDKEAEGHPIARLSRRVYDYVNHVTHLEIEEFGQENLMSIQYYGRGENTTEPYDQYKPHCDGDCEGGLPHKTGTRMATVVMYCNVPKKGGATNFKNSGVHVKPEKGAAVFFSYINPKDMTMDRGYTVHSGCPVIEGEKKIVAQWVRHGVDSENPWDSFNTLGVKYSENE